MKLNPVPEILVPPDMENSDIEEPKENFGFPVKRLLIMILLSTMLVFSCGMGISVYIKTEQINEVIPYWIFFILLIFPTSFSFYFFFSYFSPRLRSINESDDDLD